MNKGVVVFFKEERLFERRLSAGFPARRAHRPGYRFRGSPVHSQRGVGAGALALREDGEWLYDCGYRLQER